MESIKSVILNLLAAALFAILGFLLTKLGLFDWLRDVATVPLPSPNQLSERIRNSRAVSPPAFLEGPHSPEERARWLLKEDHREALDDLAFLKAGDVINGLRLRDRIRAGETTVLWTAEVVETGRPVGVRFLRHSMVFERSVVCQFQAATQLLSRLQNTSVVGAEDCIQWPDEDTPLTWYCVLKLCEGVPLDDFVIAYPERRTDVLLALAELARDLYLVHKKGVVFRNLTPSGLWIEDLSAGAPAVNIQLVDFDSVVSAGNPVLRRSPATLGFSAPEVFDMPSDVDRTADIFSLARIVAFVYSGGYLPSPYSSSVTDVVKLLNCPAAVKRLLDAATSVNRAERPESMLAFGKALERAVTLGERPLVFETIPHERRKIYLLLAHSCFGTFLMMIIARPLLTLWPGVELSDRVPVAMFHGVIGSLMWGTWIPAFFLLYLMVYRNRYKASRGVAALFGAAGGLIAGGLCALPSILVTNEKTLKCLGWLSNSDLADGAWGRIVAAVTETRMGLAFPLTGLLTGIGVALCLDRGISIAIEVSSGGTGVLPVPSKDETFPPAAIRKSLGQVLGAWQSHAYLAVPFVFASLVVLFLDPAQNYAFDEYAKVCYGLTPHVWLRSFGEGAVHYLGAIGLVTGFFYAIPLIKPTWR